MPVGLRRGLPRGQLGAGDVQLLLQLLELADFGRDFGATVRLRHYLSLVVGYAPYQLILGAAAVTAVVRELRGERSWSKTASSAEFQAHDLTLVPRGEMAA